MHGRFPIWLVSALALPLSAAPLTLEDLHSVKSPGYMQLSPNGQELVYSLGGNLWLVSTRGAESPKQLAAGSIPAWSRDGNRLAYYSNESGNQQLWVRDMRSGKTERVTNLKGGIRPDPRTRVNGWIGDPLRYSWSPDGARLVFVSQAEAVNPRPEVQARRGGDAESGTPLILTAETPAAWTLSGVFSHAFGEDRSGPLPPLMPSQLFVADVERGTVQRLTNDDAIYFNPAWSPDGRTIVCSSSDGRNPALGPSNLYAIDPASGRKSPLTKGDGDKRVPLWSPDGKWIAYIGGRHLAMQSVFVIPSAGGDPVNAGAQAARYITQFEWEPDSRSLVLLEWDGVDWPLVRVRLPDGRPVRITGGAAMRQFFAVSGEGTVVWEQEDGMHAGAVLLKGAAGTSTLADVNPQVRKWNLGEQEVVEWKNGRGDRLQGVLIRPAGFRAGRKYPLIVDGYPSQPNGFKGSPMMGNQMWASRGYAVFWPNARAPHTWMNPYREEGFGAAGKGPEGWDQMVDDVLSGADELIRRGVADPDRMGLYGFSNGGGVVNYLVTRTNRFKCAVSVAGVYPDWLLPMLLHTDSTIPAFEGGASPWDDPGAYVKLSAVFQLKSVTTPMLLAAGDNDGDFLLGMIEMYNGLRWLGKEVTFLRYAGQGHGFGGPAMTDFWDRETAFMDRYLKP
jgi:dipeptidyl aminopeptidase/acylaminoacyl peptidase